MFSTNTNLCAVLASSMIAGSAAADQLNIYNWSDYTPPELIEKFEAETGIDIVLDTYDSNETVLAKLQSGGAGYDIVVVSHDFVPIFISEGLLQSADVSELNGYDNIEERWKSPEWDPGNVYSAPWLWGKTSFAYNTSVYDEPVTSLEVLFNPPEEMAGKTVMFGSPSEVISLAQVYLGLPHCETDPAKMAPVAELLENQREALLAYNSSGTIERLVSSEAYMHQMWDGTAIRARLQNPDVQFVAGEEGTVGWFDSIVIPKDAPNYDNARQFMSFVMQPENAAIMSNFNYYNNAIPASAEFFNDDMRTANELIIPAGYNVSFPPACPPEATALMDRLWTRLKR